MLAPSATQPMPDEFANPIPHLWRMCSSIELASRLMIVRFVDGENAPTVESSDFWQQAASSMAAAGRLRQTAIDWEKKPSFLSYYRKAQKPGPGSSSKVRGTR